ncbi:MAG: zinc ribbon domain-containing protein, partial [Acidobacteria bacterium]
MYCPNCGQASPDDRRFCKFCGTNLGLVSEALSRGRVSNTNLSDATAQIIEQWFGEKPDPPPGKRQLNDIRSGVITTFVGIGLSAFLYFLMEAVASSSHIDPGAVP